MKGYITYNLPFGKNGLWLNHNHLLNYLVGGWTTSGDVNYQSGSPLPAITSSVQYPGWGPVYANVSGTPSHLFKRLDLANPADPSNTYFNISTYSNPVFGQFGNQQPYQANLRGWASYNEDLSVLKHFSFGPDGRYGATLRADFFDLFNRHTYWNPNGGSTTTQNVGQVLGVSGNRTGQFGARFTW